MSRAEVFDRFWHRYDEWYQRNRVIAELELSVVKRLVKYKPILEVGVGTGFFASRLGFEYGIDPSINMLRVARRRGIEVVQGVGEYLPFRNSSFKTVVFIVTLCFVDDVVKVLKEAYRVLDSCGEVIACIVPKESPWGKYYVKKALEGHPFYSNARFLTVEELIKYVEGQGFKIVESIGILSFKPTEEPAWEEPQRNISGKGFVCLKAVKEVKNSLNFTL